MSFILFRNGSPLTLSSGESIKYDYLKDQQFTDHQARAVYIQAQSQLDKATLDAWIKDLKDPKKKHGRSQELNKIISSTMAPATGLAPEKPKRAASRKRKTKEKSFFLYSRSNHVEAKKQAEKRGLVAKSIPTGEVPKAVATDAYYLSADEKTASSLITTGYWMTAQK